MQEVQDAVRLTPSESPSVLYFRPLPYGFPGFDTAMMQKRWWERATCRRFPNAENWSLSRIPRLSRLSTRIGRLLRMSSGFGMYSTYL